MRHIYATFGLLTTLAFNNLNAQVLIDEDFSTATGTTPPAGWVNDEILAGGGLWYFDNPGGQTADSPMSEPFAVFDGDYNGGWSDAETALESVSFDASSLSGYIFLSFDHLLYNSWGEEEVYVEVWDGNNWTEIYSGDEDADFQEHQMIDITAAVNGAADAKVRFRWVSYYGYWWIVDNVKVEHFNCLPVSGITITGTGTNSLDLLWNAGASETSWNIEWGMPGFTPGANEEEGSAVATDVVHTIAGLNSGTDYEIYVQADCQGSGGTAPWISVMGTTDCAPIATLPWHEGFEGIQDIDYDGGNYANCWTASEDLWFADYNEFNTYDVAYEGTQFMAVYAWDTDTIWTPEFELEAGTHYELKFQYKTDGYGQDWTVNAVVRNGEVIEMVPGGNIIEPTSPVVEEYTQVTVCFTPQADGIYNFGVASANAEWDAYYLIIDDFSLIERPASAGNDGEITVCQTEGLVDLEEVAEIMDEYGSWNFQPNPNTIENETMFNPAYIPAGTVNVQYTTTGCLMDTVTATITIVAPSSAGEESVMEVCKNQPFDLLGGLSGNVDLGGDWYDPSDDLLNSSFVSGLGFPGDYNYDYVVGNGTCPDDSATIVVTVLSNCDYLAIEDLAFENVQLYPNPSTGILNIDADRVFEIIVTDANGRILQQNNTTVIGTTSLDLSNVERGLYLVALRNENTSKVFRVVME